MRVLSAAAFVALWVALGAASAHGVHGHGLHHALGPYPVAQTDFGIAGHPRKLSRTVLVDMREDLRFAPDTVRVKQGDTLRFVLHNSDRVRHEWVLGDRAEIERQAAARRANAAALPEQVHALHVDPGQTEEVVWTFNRVGTFQFACVTPGHREGGMVGSVTVMPAAPR
ncbi:MAG TPA: plastocyanin/azurin family copper-binding protein [Albitalea sp.]|nr:plastocyanin/azurin family copper-binding protein [Albitalea sp.]